MLCDINFFRMNSKELKPPPISVEFLLHFKHHPASFGLKSHPRILLAFSTRKSGAKNFSVTPHFTAHLLLKSSLMTNSLTHHIFPPPTSFTQPPFFTILTRGLLIISQTSMGVLQKPTSAAKKRSFA